jgi:hypothetical protein
MFMKTFVLSVLVLMTWGSLSQAAVGIRDIRCYTDFNSTLLYSGTFYVYTDGFPHGVIARRVIGINNGKCVLSNATLMPKCSSIVMNTFRTPPCSL